MVYILSAPLSPNKGKNRDVEHRGVSSAGVLSNNFYIMSPPFHAYWFLSSSSSSCLTRLGGTLGLELLVVGIASVGAGHVVAVPVRKEQIESEKWHLVVVVTPMGGGCVCFK